MQNLELRKRRIRVVAAFIALVVVGYLLFHLSPAESSLKGVGVAFMIAWLPGVAWFTVWFARKRAPLVGAPPGFARNAPLSVHGGGLVALTQSLTPTTSGGDSEVVHCLLLLGTEGFTARLWRPGSSHSWAAGHPDRVNVQFLRPELALPRFAANAVAQILVKGVNVGTLEFSPRAEA